MNLNVFFLLLFVILVSHLTPIAKFKNMKIYWVMFSSKSFIVLAPIFTSLIHFELIFVDGVRSVKLYSLYTVYPVVLGPFAEKLLFPY